MSILSGFFKTKRYRKTADGYKLESNWTSGNTVELDDGNTVQNNVGAIKGITTSTSVTEEGYAADATTVAALNNSLDELNSNLATQVIATASDGSNSYRLSKSANVYTLNIQGCIVTYNGTIKKYILSNLGNALIIHNVVPKIQVTNLLFDNTNKKLMVFRRLFMG